VVFVLRAGKPEPVAIRTGISDGTVTELLEGALQPGDELVTDATGPSGGRAASGGGGGGRGGPPRIL
jgi:HlyD family secretion protein